MSGKRVLCAGTFDLLHPGHDSLLKQARELGDELFVVVARDTNVKRIKGRAPQQHEQERLQVVRDCPVVDDARLGHHGSDFLRVVREIAPDIIALGYDQRPPPGLAEAFPGCRVETLESYHPDRYKTSLMRSQGSGPS